MADLIEAKLAVYDIPSLRYHCKRVLREAGRTLDLDLFRSTLDGLPQTFVEPGKNLRWIFNVDIASAIASLRFQILKIDDPAIQRLLKVLLGCKLVDVSNVIVNGKGRRYRRNWQFRGLKRDDVFSNFSNSCAEAISDIVSYLKRPETSYTICRGDVRQVNTENLGKVDFVLTSPPYPNSFDYTDIYNVELWTLGYLNSWGDNYTLRHSTLRSHVQLANFEIHSTLKSRTLAKAYKDLRAIRADLWNSRIPEMACHYFEDLRNVLIKCRSLLTEGCQMVLTVGNSRYSGVLIDVPKILSEIAPSVGFTVVKIEAVRAMRSSAQQGGRQDLDESLVWLST